MTYQEFLDKSSFSKEELLAYSWGNLLSNPPKEGCGILPAPPMLMFDRITKIEHDGRKGKIVAEQDINLDDWFFQCHFRKDPVQPGCLGVDAVWQLTGFYACLRGALGSGRALGSKEIEFFGQIRPHNKLVTYEVEIRRYSAMAAKKMAIAIGSAEVSVDGEPIYRIQDAKVGVFENLAYTNYPFKSEHALGGQITR